MILPIKEGLIAAGGKLKLSWTSVVGNNPLITYYHTA